MVERNGGPAFPQHVAPAYRQEPEIWGMSLRDWFAGMALNGLALSDMTASDGAAAAYDLADAMLAERERQP